MKIAEAKKQGQQNASPKATMNGEAVIKFIEKGFKDEVKPTWSKWQKDVVVSMRRHA